MKCKFRHDFTKFFFLVAKWRRHNIALIRQKCVIISIVAQALLVNCVFYVQNICNRGDDLTCDACQRRFHKNCSIGTFKSALLNPNSEDVRDDYVELFGTCEYVDSQNHNWLNNKKIGDLFLIHFNLRSLQKNIDKLCDYLAGFKNQPEIVAISETKLREGYINRNIELEGYTFFHSDSKTQAGGVGIYIKNSLQYSINQCTKICLTKTEHLWVDISTNQRSVTVGVVNRHPDDSATAIDKFNEEFNELLVLLNNTKCPFYCLGDFNVN